MSFQNDHEQDSASTVTNSYFDTLCGLLWFQLEYCLLFCSCVLGSKERMKIKKKKTPALLTLHPPAPCSTDTDEPRTDDLDSDWLNTRKGKSWADKASSKGISLRLSQFSGASNNPDLQSVLNLLLSLSNIVKELSVKEQLSNRAGYQAEETIQLIASCALGVFLHHGTKKIYVYIQK